MISQYSKGLTMARNLQEIHLRYLRRELFRQKITKSLAAYRDLEEETGLLQARVWL
jgi:hypothetical protein